MQTVTVLAVGSLREAAWAQAAAEYTKRLQAWCRLTVLETAEHRLPRNPSPAEVLKAMEMESMQMMQKIPPRSIVAALCIEGKKMTSEQFSMWIAEAAAVGRSPVFAVGGSHGLSKELKTKADLCISMSDMTFPHQLARVMLLEQIYRAFAIQNGSRYHK